MVDFGAGAPCGGARDGHAVDLNDRNTRAIQVTACRRADHRSHRAAPERHRPDHRALSHPPDASREFFGAGVVSPSRLRKGFGRESASETQTGNARARLTMATHAHLDPPARIAWRGPVNARRARRGDPTGRPRRAPRVAGTPDVHANEDRASRRGARLVPSASADDGRDDAAEAARLAPLEASTAMGSELERILKTDPVAFDRALSDQVGCAPSLPPRPQSLLTLGVYAFLADPSRIRPRRRPSVRSDAAPHADRRGDGGPARRRVRARTGRLWEQHAPRAARRAVPPAHPAANKKRNDHFCPLELAPYYFPEKHSSHELVPFSRADPFPVSRSPHSFARLRPTCFTRRSPADAPAPSATPAASPRSVAPPRPSRGTAVI